METTVNARTTATANYPPSLPFTIESLLLRIEPDFSAKKIIGEEQLKVLAKQDISEIGLDIGPRVTIKSVIYSTGADADTSYDKRELHPQIQNGKLLIPLENELKEGTRFYLIIQYTAEDAPDGLGFHFEDGNSEIPPHAWTLSESIHARKWFPCFDHPEVKFQREISVVVPAEYTVLSNGELDIIDHDIETDNGVKKRKFVWKQTTPDTAYLTSVVIGKYVETSGGEHYNGIPLRYYVPHGREADAQRTFKNTAQMMKIFEEYFNMKYPYNKYSQVVVLNLATLESKSDGMEHTSCTTLDIEQVLAKSTTPDDLIAYDVIAHELAHHWFGDLVTCRDWQDLWLNEGFAAFCEALYFEKSKGEQGYQTYIAQMVQKYLKGTQDISNKTPIRAIVTNKYEHPDDLFDHNTYYKGGVVLHMLRKYLGEENFKRSLYTYLQRFQYKTSQTEDLRQILEEVSGINLQQFFEQWVYREGHPQLKVQVSDDAGKVKLIITQHQKGDAFVFPLDLEFVLSSSDSSNENDQQGQRIEQIQFSEKTFSRTFDIPIDKLDHVAIDPEYKILKEYLSVDIPEKLISNQLQKGKTASAKVEAAQLLRRMSPSVESALNTVKRALPNTSESLVHVEAMRILGSADKKSNDSNTNEQIHKHLARSLEETTDPGARRAIIDSMGHFPNTDSFDLLKGISQNDNADPYERYFAAIAIGNSKRPESIQLLKNLADTISYHNLVARGAVEGLKIIVINSKDKRTKEELENLIIEKAKDTKDSRLRRTCASALGYIARYRENKTKILDKLKELLDDESFYVRNTACVAIANALEGTNDSAAMQVLTKIASEDTDSVVRARAMVCINIIKTEDKAKEKIRTGIIEEQTKIDSKYKSDKFDLLEEITVLP